jgi:hypothetical protein
MTVLLVVLLGAAASRAPGDWDQRSPVGPLALDLFDEGPLPLEPRPSRTRAPGGPLCDGPSPGSGAAGVRPAAPGLARVRIRLQAAGIKGVREDIRSEDFTGSARGDGLDHFVDDYGQGRGYGDST